MRFSGPGQPYEGLVRIGKQGPRWTGSVKLVAAKLDEPLSWSKPRRVFVNSMSDLFHEGLSNEDIAAVFGVMAAAPRHTFQVLTKRAKRMREWFEWVSVEGASVARVNRSPVEWSPAMACYGAATRAGADVLTRDPAYLTWPLPNVWLGASVEDQERAEERIPDLAATPAALHFLSCEPLLGPLNLFGPRLADTGPFGAAWLKRSVRTSTDYGTGDEHDVELTQAVDWVIVGGESGPGARRCELDWVRSVVGQCRDAQVPCFVKQLGAAASDPANGLAGRSLKIPQDAQALVSRRLTSAKGDDAAEWPPGDWPQDFPSSTASFRPAGVEYQP